MASEAAGDPAQAQVCRLCGNAADRSPCPSCDRALEQLRGFPGIDHWEHVAGIASRILQLPAKQRIILEILLLELEH
jgi:hypothetical protein